MTTPKTLLQLVGADLAPTRLRDACLLLIDIQNEYLEGPIAVPDFRGATANAARLLEGARNSAAPVIHIAHRGRVGGLFDRDDTRGQIAEATAPLPGEPVVEKQLPNAFANTDLYDRVVATGRGNLVLTGFMTHMCVSSTARAALDLGLRVTIAADACATRDLPDGRGGVIASHVVHEVTLAALADRFAVIARCSDDVL